VTPNQVTAIRVLTAFGAVALFSLGEHTVALDLAALSLTITAIALDAVDGYIARTHGLATPLGAQFDILGDRVVENLFFTCFAAAGLISLWVPVFFFVRGTATDFLRGLAARAGRSGFDGNSMLETWWGRSLVSSRASRAAYATLKCICFCALGIALSLRDTGATQAGSWAAAAGSNWPLPVAQTLAGIAVAFCVIRAIPVLWEGRRYLRGVERPPERVAPVLVSR